MTAEHEAETSVDLSNMLEIAGENQEMISTLIIHLLDEYPVKIAAMHQAIATNDTEKLSAITHKLKGMVINYGAQRAYDLILALENMGLEYKLDVAPATIAELEREFSRIELYLKKHYL